MYYTAAWGSPYQLPSGSREGPSAHRHRWTISSDLSDGSPSRRSELTRPQPSDWTFAEAQTSVEGGRRSVTYASRTLEPALADTASDPEKIRPIRDFTEDWIRQYLSGQSNSERGNWWSDDSVGNRSHSTTIDTSGKHHESDESWLGLDNNYREKEVKIPTVSNFVKLREKARSQATREGYDARRHKLKNSTETLKPRDFWSICNESEEDSAISRNMLASKFADSPPRSEQEEKSRSAPIDKPLPPPPPFERTISEAPVLNATPRTPDLSTNDERPLHSSAGSLQRPKRRVVWRGKACIIALPLIDGRGQGDDKLHILTHADVEERLREWHCKGYDTEGFGHSKSSDGLADGEAEGQSRVVYPDPEEVRREWERGIYRVSIPDRREWEAYVNFLKEEKLRALGVSFGNEVLNMSKSPVPPSMSRQSSRHPGLPISPPLPGSSAASNHTAQHTNPFSPPFVASTNPSSRVASIASPGSQYAGMYGNFHIPGHSMASPLGYPQQQPTPPNQGIWSSEGHTASQHVPRGGSPALTGSFQSLGTAVAPDPPGQESNQQVPGQSQSDLRAHTRSGQRQLQGQLLQQQLQQQQQLNPQPYPHLSKLPEHEGKPEHEMTYRSQPEIANPIPRGHRHNPSETLQKEIDDAEHHLEESIQSQLEKDEQQSLAHRHTAHAKMDLCIESGFGTTSPDAAHGHGEEAGDRMRGGLALSRVTQTKTDDLILSQMHNGARSRSKPQLGVEANSANAVNKKGMLDGISKSTANYLSDIDTNPSDSELLDERVPAGGSIHTHYLSASNGARVIPASTSAGTCFSPTQPGHQSKPSMSKLNVDAKEFKFDPRTSFAHGNFPFAGNYFASAASADLPASPPQANNAAGQVRSNLFGAIGSNFNVAAPAFTPAYANVSAFPTGDFSFSSSGPSFKPSAPEFSPESGSKTISDTAGTGQSGSEGPASGASKIFGNLNLADIVKPARRSKAIAIVKPDDLQGSNERDDEGQEDESGRITRAEGRQKRMRRGASDGDQIPRFATPSHPLIEAGLGQSPHGELAKLTEPSVAERENTVFDQEERKVLSRSLSRQSSISEGKAWEPFEFSHKDEAESFNAARPLSTSLMKHSTLAIHDEVTSDAMEVLSVPRSESLSDADGTITKESQRPADADNTTITHTGKPSLSATAKSFEFSGENSSFNFNIGEETGQPLAAQNTGGLANSRFANSPSPPVFHNNPATMLRSRDVDFPFASIRQSRKDVPYPNSAGVNYDSLIEPSFHEIDAVMKHLNEDDSDLGVERTDGPWIRPDRVGSLEFDSGEPTRVHKLLPGANLRGDARSPSVKRLQQQYQNSLEESTDIEFQSCQGNFMNTGRPGIAVESPVHRLNNAGDVPISDWDDAISSTEDIKLQHRTRFFDNHVDDLVGGLLQERLEPLEKTLAVIQESLAHLSTESTSRRDRRSMSAEIEHSDADDEDDVEDAYQARTRSPRKDRRLENMKTAIVEALAAQQVPASASTSTSSDVLRALSELKETVSGTTREYPQVENLKAIVEDAVARQMRGRSNPIKQSHEAATAEKYQLQISGLESMLNVADTRADDELRARRGAEDALADTQRLLRIAEEESAHQRESAEETERSLRAFHDDRQQTMIRAALLESAQENLQTTASELSAKNTALEGTLEEYRLSRDQWREDIDVAMDENRDLRRNVDTLRTEMEESLRFRQGLRGKFDRLQEDMTLAAQHVAHDRASWKRREEDHIARNELLGGRLQAEARTRDRLELEVERLEEQAKEAMRFRVAVEHMQSANQRLEDMVDNLRLENIESQKTAARFEREFNDARETGLMEVHRTRVSMEADIEAANNQVNIIRANLESGITRLKTQLENSQMDADTTKARHELMLEEASDSRNTALREAAEAREAALQEHYRFHERTLEELKAQHQRALHNALEDKQRAETYLLERLGLSDAKTDDLLDKVAHLEEKLEIAKSAAHAVAQAAQTARGTSTLSPAWTASIPLVRGSDLPEKISPQALRESIMVLQEQLQEREGRLEKLEQELSTVDTEAPAKIKDRDVEISWLRELLGVRIDDLEDIINTLSQPEYDREAAKGAVIRLKANLQMEQQEKERALAGGQTFPSLASISNLASSPRALPLAAAAAWGNWRKNRDTSFGNLSETASGASQTPSKSAQSSTPSFLSGLLTPPSANIRQRPPASGTSLSRQVSSVRPLRAYSPSRPTSSRQQEKQRAPPATPPLMRRGSYDQDAESTSGYYDDDVSTIDGNVGDGKNPERREPFGPNMNA